MNYRDFWYLPEDGRIYEIIDGELHNMAPPTVRHQDVSKRIVMILYNYLEKKDIGIVYHAPIGVVLGNEDIVQPDVIFISRARGEIIKEREIRGTPDLIIEILSPRRKRYDRTIKKKLYSKYKVPEYWVVSYTNEWIEVYSLKEDRYELFGKFEKQDTNVLRSKLFPKLKVKLDEVF
jgi:Uma2 family endonuclease